MLLEISEEGALYGKMRYNPLDLSLETFALGLTEKGLDLF